MPTYPPWIPTIVAGVPALPAPVPTDEPPGVPPGFCTGGADASPYCTPVPASPTPQHVPLTPTPIPGAATWETGGATFATWGYTYQFYPSEDDLWAFITYDASSVDSIQAYVATNRTLATEVAQMGGGARVDITFRTVQPLSQIHDWAVGHGLYNGWIGLRVVDPQGVRADYLFPLVYNLPLSLASSLPYTSPQGQEGEYRVEGVFYLSGLVEARRLPEIVADPAVFLADVTPNMARTDLMSKRPLPLLSGLNWVSIQPVSPFRRMEELGLDHFR